MSKRTLFCLTGCVVIALPLTSSADDVATIGDMYVLHNVRSCLFLFTFFKILVMRYTKDDVLKLKELVKELNTLLTEKFACNHIVVNHRSRTEIVVDVYERV